MNSRYTNCYIQLSHCEVINSRQIPSREILVTIVIIISEVSVINMLSFRSQFKSMVKCYNQ